MAIFTVKTVSAVTVPPFGGKTNLEEGMLAVDGMSPMGVGSHDPPVICRPLVMVLPAQKLIKLLVDVNDAT